MRALLETIKTSRGEGEKNGERVREKPVVDKYESEHHSKSVYNFIITFWANRDGTLWKGLWRE